MTCDLRFVAAASVYCQQQSYSGPHSPGWSYMYSTYFWHVILWYRELEAFTGGCNQTKKNTVTGKWSIFNLKYLMMQPINSVTGRYTIVMYIQSSSQIQFNTTHESKMMCLKISFFVCWCMKKERHITCLNTLDLVGKCISPIACPVVSLHVKPEFAAEHFVIILRKAYVK